MQTYINLAEFTQIGVLKQDGSVVLLRKNSSGIPYVLKRMTIFRREIFERLMQTPVEGTPRIEAVAEDNGALYVLEQYIPGTTLETLLDRGRAYSDYEALVFCEQLCCTVSRLHRLKPAIIHRDIKPSNIMITPQGDLYLIDFNAAREDLGQKSSDTELLGTPGYAAPEQYGFRSSCPATDIYALGVVLNRLLTGALPRDRQPENAVCRRIVMKAVQIDPAKRYGSAGKMRIDLRDSAEACCAGHKGRPGFRTFMLQYGLPGLRRLTWWKMIPALAVYGFMVLSLILLGKAGEPIGTLLFGAALYWTVLSYIFLFFNYRGFREKLPFVKRCRKKVWKLILGSIFLFIVDLALVAITSNWFVMTPGA